SLRWRQVFGVTFEKVVDDQGQMRKGEMLPPPPKPPAQRGTISINGQVIDPEDDTPTGEARHIPLRFDAAPKPARSLKEVKGTVTALVQSAPEDLVTVHDVLKAVGKRFAGPQGTSVLVADITRQDNGTVRLRVDVAAMPEKLSDGSAASTMFNQNII